MNATIKTKCGIVTEEVFIVPNLEKPLLSRKAGVALKIIQKVNEINKVHKLNEVDEVTEKVTTSAEYKQKIVREYPELFTGLCEIPGEYHLKLMKIQNPLHCVFQVKYSCHFSRKPKMRLRKSSRWE